MTADRKLLQEMLDLAHHSVEFEQPLYGMDVSAEFRKGSDYQIKRMRCLLKNLAFLNKLTYPPRPKVELTLIVDNTGTQKKKKPGSHPTLTAR